MIHRVQNEWLNAQRGSPGHWVGCGVLGIGEVQVAADLRQSTALPLTVHDPTDRGSDLAASPAEPERPRHRYE